MQGLLIDDQIKVFSSRRGALSPHKQKDKGASAYRFLDYGSGKPCIVRTQRNWHRPISPVANQYWNPTIGPWDVKPPNGTTFPRAFVYLCALREMAYSGFSCLLSSPKEVSGEQLTRLEKYFPP